MNDLIDGVRVTGQIRIGGMDIYDPRLDVTEPSEVAGADDDQRGVRALCGLLQRPGGRVACDREPLDVFDVEERERDACEEPLRIVPQPDGVGMSVEARLSRLR